MRSCECRKTAVCRRLIERSGNQPWNQPSASGVAVAADGLDRATFQRLCASRNILFRRRLLAHEGIATLFGTGKESRGRLTAEVAIDALLVDVEFS